MHNSVSNPDREAESIRDKLRLVAITVVLAAIALLLRLPMWVTVPGIGIGTVGIWYAMIKMKDSKKRSSEQP